MKKSGSRRWVFLAVMVLVALTYVWLEYRVEPAKDANNESVGWYQTLKSNASHREIWDEFLREFIVLGLLVLVWEAIHNKIESAHRKEERDKSSDNLILLLTFLFEQSGNDEENKLQLTPMGRFLRREKDNPLTEGLQVYSFQREPLLYGFDSVVDQLRNILHEDFRPEVAKIFKLCWDLSFLNNRYHALNSLDIPASKKEELQLKLNLASMRLSILSRLSKLKESILNCQMKEGMNGETYRLSRAIQHRFSNMDFSIGPEDLTAAKAIVGDHDDIADCYARTFKEFLKIQDEWRSAV